MGRRLVATTVVLLIAAACGSTGDDGASNLSGEESADSPNPTDVGSDVSRSVSEPANLGPIPSSCVEDDVVNEVLGQTLTGETLEASDEQLSCSWIAVDEETLVALTAATGFASPAREFDDAVAYFFEQCFGSPCGDDELLDEVRLLDQDAPAFFVARTNRVADEFVLRARASVINGDVFCTAEYQAPSSTDRIDADQLADVVAVSELLCPLPDSVLAGTRSPVPTDEAGSEPASGLSLTADASCDEVRERTGAKGAGTVNEAGVPLTWRGAFSTEFYSAEYDVRGTVDVGLVGDSVQIICITGLDVSPTPSASVAVFVMPTGTASSGTLFDVHPDEMGADVEKRLEYEFGDTWPAASLTVRIGDLQYARAVPGS